MQSSKHWAKKYDEATFQRRQTCKSEAKKSIYNFIPILLRYNYPLTLYMFMVQGLMIIHIKLLYMHINAHIHSNGYNNFS